MGKFRTPTLRNVEVTGPYMNDGTVYSLKTAILIHTDGGRNVTQGSARGDGRTSPLRDPALPERIIDADDMQALIVFLHSLTDDEFLTRPELSNPL